MGWSGAGLEDQSPSPTRVALALTRHGGPMECAFRPWSWTGQDKCDCEGCTQGPSPIQSVTLANLLTASVPGLSSSEEDV